MLECILQQELIKKMCKENGVLVTSFAGIRQHQDHLLAQRFDYVILDEGHKIRNPDAEITLACKQVKWQAVLFYVKSLDTLLVEYHLQDVSRKPSSEPLLSALQDARLFACGKIGDESQRGLSGIADPGADLSRANVTEDLVLSRGR